MPPDLRIRWAPKLQPHKLVRLYQSDAAGRLDEELLDDIGWTIYARLADVLRIHASHVRCPSCGAEFTVRWLGELEETASTCPSCGWETTAGEYHRSFEHRDLVGYTPEFEQFVDAYPAARTPHARMLLIDRVVHAIHQVMVKGGYGNFAARNILEGNRPKIAAVLESLAYGPASTVDVEARARWEETDDRYRAGC